MGGPMRAGWGKPCVFTDQQKSDLAFILRRQRTEKIEQFLKAVENSVPLFRSDWQGAVIIPIEKAKKSIEVLNKIAKYSKALNEAIDSLDLTGSELPLCAALVNLGRGDETIEYLKHDLPLVHICAKEAANSIRFPPPGRSPDLIERQFIAYVGKSYVSCFDKKPTYSRGTEFPNFISKVMEIVQPGNPHSARDNSKIVTAALKRAGIIS